MVKICQRIQTGYTAYKVRKIIFGDMRYRLTSLNATAAIYLVGCALFTIIDYKNLSSGEGWGVVFMVGLAAIGVVALIVDLILQQFVSNSNIFHILTIIFIAIVAFSLFT